MAEKLVSCDWVAEHGGDAGVRLVEVDVDTEAYAEGHVAGAVGWNWTTQLQDQVSRDILSQADFEQLMNESGIAADTHVVLYGDNNNWFAAYALWLVELYGHDNVSLMDGGRVKWLGDNRPMTQDAAGVSASSGYRAQAPNLALRADRNDILGAVAAGVQMVDVRSPAEFTGEIIAPPGMSETAQRAGHVPGAQNIPWAKAANEDGTFKSVDELTKIYGDAGIAQGTATIAYCRIGERSSHTWFALRHILGNQNVKNYDGSWTEYGSMIGVPIEK